MHSLVVASLPDAGRRPMAAAGARPPLTNLQAWWRDSAETVVFFVYLFLLFFSFGALGVFVGPAARTPGRPAAQPPDRPAACQPGRSGARPLVRPNVWPNRQTAAPKTNDYIFFTFLIVFFSVPDVTPPCLGDW